MLRVYKAHPLAIKYAKEWRCPVCARWQRPGRQRWAGPKGEEAYEFNRSVAVDLFFVKDTVNREYAVINILDQGTTFEQLRVLADRTSVEAARGFAE
eukprot:1878691-Alexandrium_andersonii.AAC.1